MKAEREIAGNTLCVPGIFTTSAFFLQSYFLSDILEIRSVTEGGFAVDLYDFVAADPF